MKPVRFISVGVLLLSLGALTPMYAQHDQHGQDAQPSKQEQQAKPEKQQQGQQKQQQARGQQNQQQQRAQQTAATAGPGKTAATAAAGQRTAEPAATARPAATAGPGKTAATAAASQGAAGRSSNSAPSSNSRARKDSGNNSSKPGGSRIGSSNSALHSYGPLRSGNVSGSSNSGLPGSSIAPATGTPNTALGSNVAVTMATAFPTTITALTMAEIIGSTSGAYRLWSWAGIRAFSTMAIGSRFLIPIRITGETIGTRPTTCTLTTATAGITSTTAGILAVQGLRLAFRSEWKPQTETVAA